MIGKLTIVVRREWSAYFANPVGLLFLFLFGAVSIALTFFVGGFFEREIADLEPFFQFHPWIYLLLMPALGMRLWAEEYKSGSAELLLTLPLPISSIVLGKFFAAWLVLALALSLCFPIWITVNVLGDPDNGVIFAGFCASWLLGGAFLAISACMSAATKNQVNAFIASGSICLILLLLGLPVVLDVLNSFLPALWVDRVGRVGVLHHYSQIARGVIDPGDVLYFVMLMAAALLANGLLVELQRVPK